ncbi:DUF192 domain-containing protein [Megasphaera cerevisiae]|uniref:DUF192 domain-containing protein n=1 Tax=Megasphaera cerevisiae TaxID=39029 RepID=UPI000944A5BF|nr:DUF192 domain-containing protein [Megasphaera cerevisiae]OKY54318.1 hypothetical protein BSR42_03300 [Megasphaera cerevisiae]
MRQICAVHAAGKPEVRLYVADSFWERLRGLLGTKQLPDHTGLLLKKCNSIHMFFMRYALDIVYVDRNFQIIKLVHNVRPWQISGCWKAAHTIEVPVGTIAVMGWEENMDLFVELV